MVKVKALHSIHAVDAKGETKIHNQGAEFLLSDREAAALVERGAVVLVDAKVEEVKIEGNADAPNADAKPETETKPAEPAKGKGKGKGAAKAKDVVG